MQKAHLINGAGFFYVRDVHGITFRSYNVGFLCQEGCSHEAHSYSTQRMRAAFLVQKDSLEIGRLFRARSLNGLGGLWDAWCDGGRRCAFPPYVLTPL